MALSEAQKRMGTSDDRGGRPRARFPSRLFLLVVPRATAFAARRARASMQTYHKARSLATQRRPLPRRDIPAAIVARLPSVRVTRTRLPADVIGRGGRP